MIQIQGKLDREVFIACSGGVDSMAIVDFLSRGKRKVNLMFFDHGTQTSYDALKFLREYVSNDPTKELCVGNLTENKDPSESWEEYWRNQRLQWFHAYSVDIITGHHLDDCVETWIWSCMHGAGKLIPYRNGNVIRPFRLNRKSEFVNWCQKHDVPWIEDETNADTKHMRNFIRKEVVDKCLTINPGLHKVIRKKILSDFVD